MKSGNCPCTVSLRFGNFTLIELLVRPGKTYYHSDFTNVWFTDGSAKQTKQLTYKETLPNY